MPLDALLARANARLRVRDALRAAAAGLLVCGALLFGLRAAGANVLMARAAVLVVLAAATAWIFLARGSRRGARAAAAAIERADSTLQNLVITAGELIESPGATRPYMRQRILTEAARRAAAVDLRQAVPLRRDGIVLAVAMVAMALASSVRLPAASAGAGAHTAGQPVAGRAAIDLIIDILPPAYSGRASSRLINPASVEVLAGTEAALRVSDASTSARIRLNGGLLTRNPAGDAHTTFVESGYIALDAGEVHRLVPLTVTPDRVPDVRITAPARDLRIAATATPIAIAAEASDDLALRSLELRYTVVSGTGEQFSFTEGTLPATVTRATDRAWRLDAVLSLSRLKLEPGDALIYRAVAADRRSGDAGAGSSDIYFVEVAGPGDVPLEGVDMPPDKERYALSEAMIVLKIERLQARERTLARDALAEASGNIAAEQRAVRANFIFLLGGEVEDEEAEAEASHEISEGRFANQARRDIVAATVLMGRVEKALAAISTRDALPLAREAVRALQRAFGHSRYLLRALPSRTRIDPARRLSGDVSSALDWKRTLAPAPADPDVETARAALLELAAADGAIANATRQATAAAILDGVAERLLAHPSVAEFQSAAREVIAARNAAASGNVKSARDAIRLAAAPLVPHAQRGRVDGATLSPDAARLAGAAAIAAGGGRD